jgi:hypothetical protein
VRVLTRRHVVAIGVAVALWPSLLVAQTPQQRSGQATQGVPPTGNGLNVGLDVSGVFDSDAADEIRQRSQQGGLESGGYSSALVGNAGYRRDMRMLRLSGSVMTAIRYYAREDRLTPMSHTGGVTAVFNLARQTNITVAQTAAYSPSYLYQLFPSAGPVDPNAPIAAAPEFRVDESTSYSSMTRVSFTTPSAVGTWSASGERSGTDFYDRVVPRPSVDIKSGRLGLSWRVARRHTVSAEYHFREGDFGAGASIDQRLQVAAQYSRPLSPTRTASFRFTASPSLFRSPPTAQSGDRSRLGIETTVSGSVNLTRAWFVNGSYRRRLEYLATLGEPILNTGGSVGADGLLIGRLQFGVTGGYSEGRSALTARTQTNNLRTYTGTIRLGTQITRSISAYGQYLYYYYNLLGQAALAPDLPSRFERKSVQFGLSLSAQPLGRRR